MVLFGLGLVAAALTVYAPSATARYCVGGQFAPGGIGLTGQWCEDSPAPSPAGPVYQDCYAGNGGPGGYGGNGGAGGSVTGAFNSNSGNGGDGGTGGNGGSGGSCTQAN